MTADVLLQTLASGMLMGAAYALIAVGFTLVSGVMRIINFAHGHIVMVAMFGSYALHKYFGLDPYLALSLLLPLFLGFGVFLYRSLITPLLDAPEASQLLATIALFIFLENGINLLFGGDIRSVALPYESASLTLGQITLPLTRLIAAACSVLAVGLLSGFLHFTSFGMEIRAAADNRVGALLTGIPVQRVFLGAFALSTALAALAGGLLMPFYLIDPFVGNDFMLRAFVIAVIGGFGSVPGALIAGLMVGLIEAVGNILITASLSNVLVFALLIATLLFRPWGLFGRAGT